MSTGLSHDPLATSAATWRDRTEDPPAIPDELRPPQGVGVRERHRALWQRHALRRQRAEDVYAASRNPARGWPVSGNRAVLAFFGDLVRSRKKSFALLVALNALAAGSALVVPRLLGELVNRVQTQGAAVEGLDTLALVVVGVVLLQALFTFGAQRTSTHFGQDLLASAREYIVGTILRLPVGRVEGASTGDLVTRVTRDVGTMARSVQWGVPRLLISLLTVLLSVVAMLLNSVVLAVPALLVFSLCTPAVRTYLTRAPKAYITEGATYSRINTTLTETVEGARTVEALGLSAARVRAGSDDIEVSAQAERYGMTLRNVLFAALNGAFQVPQVVTLLVGAYAYGRGWVDLGQITAAMLYVVALSEPLDAVIGEVDRLQVGAASTSRLLGIAEVQPDREPGDRLPDGVELVGEDLRFAYREGHDVLHGVDLRLRTGERLAVVGPSGSGKSTLGRLLSGINRPRTGSARVGGVDLVDLPLEVLRTEVALVTQEHHVFIGTVRDNIVLAREDSSDDAVREALRAVGSLAWVERLPDGLDTMIGSGRFALTPAQAQQVALARLIIADPHTLVLDEATSLIDPRTARTLEGSMNNLLEGRTVVAIAHRLHTAHDADRIAVVMDGLVVELGSHDELIDLDGEYAALWRAWTS
ncbi:ABC transporter ATP-binding protein [Nocardioides ganghwensis]|jgi:ABC-type multidrug transport system fused ATPase/permease subunit|uniref:ABC transporter ATP-binding protein n=1 Tax=Nocardioides ganghwensis TaxID=252230 RepID=A0A4Q2SCE9_9ACTN|nr:ABC transporter ATP-binding protein [Nocardioides ganghwensis]MBD3945633.1 ABC transporter ATP-binding protein [Nocardioides ganghwensis]RYB99665.1 ABC transporter ATP-binding protein [Nocardioides ganghwensis]